MGFFTRLFIGRPNYRVLAFAEEFSAESELELALIDMISNTTSHEDFFDKLITSKVFIPSNSEPVPSAFEPLIFDHPRLGPVVAIFTHAKRFSPVSKLFPNVLSGILMEFPWILMHMPAGLGLIINPGWEISVEVTGEDIMDWKSGFQGRNNYCSM